MVFDAVRGVEPQSETVWRQADRFGVPRICFINKMDRPGANYWRCIDVIRERLGAAPVATQVPIGVESSFVGVVDLIDRVALLYRDDLGESPERLDVPDSLHGEVASRRKEMVEAIVETDDVLLAEYLDGEELDSTELRAALRRATRPVGRASRSCSHSGFPLWRRPSYDLRFPSGDGCCCDFHPGGPRSSRPAHGP